MKFHSVLIWATPLLLAQPFAVATAAPMGQHCAWRPAEVLRLEGEVQTGGLTGRFHRSTESGSGRLKETLDLGIARTAQGFDRKLAWVQDMSGGVHDTDSGFARRLAISMAWLDGRQGCAPAPATGLSLLETRDENGRHFQVWRATPEGGAPFDLWYGEDGHLDRAFFQMAETRLIRHFADWRDIGGGRMAAFEQRDEYPEDEDETVFHVRVAKIAPAAAPGEFARPAPPHDVTIAGGTSTTIPYEDDHRSRIYVPVFLNGKGPFTFEIDNGGHFILSQETARAVGLTTTGSFNSTGAGNAVTQSGIAKVAKLQIGNAVLSDQLFRVRAMSAQSNDRLPNPPRAGILGLELFERFIVSIDHRHKTLTLTMPGKGERPPGMAVPLAFTDDAPVITGSYEGHAGDFMLDTGNAGATIIEDFWAQPLGLTDRLGRGPARGDARYSRGEIGIGTVKLSGELASYYGPAQRGSEYTRAVAGIYGEPLLSRFNATYDYARKTVWLDPLPDAAPIPFDRSGLALVKAADGNFTVAAVLAGSPADESGIHKDDTITILDSKPAASLSRADGASLLRQAAGTRLQVEGDFDHHQVAKTLILRDLL